MSGPGRRQLRFNAFLMSSGHHEAPWRLPESNPFAGPRGARQPRGVPEPVA